MRLPVVFALPLDLLLLAFFFAISASSSQVQ